MPASEDPRIDERDMFAVDCVGALPIFAHSEASRISSEIALLGHVSLLLTAVSDALLRNSEGR